MGARQLFKSLEITSRSSTPIISTQDAKDHLRQDMAVEDSLIDSLVKVATRDAENFLDRAFLQTTCEWTISWGEYEYITRRRQREAHSGTRNPLYLPIAPLAELTRISVDGTDEDLDDDYDVSGVGAETAPGVVIPRNCWPYADKIVFYFNAGYGENVSDVPEEIIHGVKLRLADHYLYRDSMDHRKVMEVPGKTWQDQLYHYVWKV